MRVIACQDLLGKSVKVTLTSAGLFHAFEVRRPMSTFSKILGGMWIFFTAIVFTSRRSRRLIRNIGHNEKSHKNVTMYFSI